MYPAPLLINFGKCGARPPGSMLRTHPKAPHGSSAPLPSERRKSTVPLLPSGPGGVPVAKCPKAFLRKPRAHLRPRRTGPQQSHTAWQRAWIHLPRLSPPHIDGFGLQGTPNPPAKPGTMWAKFSPLFIGFAHSICFQFSLFT